MNQSRLHKPYYRNGENHRGGADVNFVDILNVFGFSSANVGKWVTSQEQQLAANLIFDGFCDLQDILQVPPQVISLNGSLSLAFGTGGQKNTCAHYNSQTKTLALAKNAGGGALAHEWFHAFDHYICHRMFSQPPRHGFASSTWLEKHAVIAHPLNHLLSDFFSALLLSDDGKKASSYLQRSVRLDKHLKQFYYARPEELSARAFEAVIQHHSIKNQFLVKGTKQSQEAQLGIYPDGEYLNQLSQLTLTYFNWLGQAITAKSPTK